VADIDLIHYGTVADAESIRDTAIAQPLLVASALSCFSELFAGRAGEIGAVSGHSVGELAASVFAGVVSEEQAMVLVRERGRAMAAAAAATPTGMTAILGGDRHEVLAAVQAHELTPANDNGTGQIVAAGTAEQLAALSLDPPARSRLIPLPVAGAFHTGHMAPAADHLEHLAVTVSTADPSLPVISNRDGAVASSGRDVLDRIVSQISSPVRWDLSMDTMLGLGATGVLELAPAGTLTGIAKRAMKGVETFALKAPEQLDAARSFCRKHAAGSDEHVLTSTHRTNSGDI
jgi:[acyl-carrier-protein] S-malonyltransferase